MATASHTDFMVPKFCLATMNPRKIDVHTLRVVHILVTRLIYYITHIIESIEFCTVPQYIRHSLVSATSDRDTTRLSAVTIMAVSGNEAEALPDSETTTDPPLAKFHLLAEHCRRH
jgi:hypothetical protein